MHRRLVRTLLMPALLAVLIVGGLTWPSASGPAPAGPVSGGKLVVGIVSGLNHIYIHDTNDRYLLQATQYMYEGLFTHDARGRTVPWLVSSYDVSPDGLTYTLRLQQGVTFHDGTPFNAAAVKWNLERKLSGKLALFWMLQVLKSVDVVDDLTVRLVLNRPNAALPSHLGLGTYGMMSPTAFQRNNADYFRTRAVGTGPYTLVEFRANEVVKLKKNANYWRKGQPYLDEIELRVIPDTSARALALQAGEVDVIVNPSETDIERFTKDPRMGLGVLTRESVDQYYVVMNNLHAPLDDRRVRQAINYALDKPAMVKSIFRGGGASVARAPIIGPMANGFAPIGAYPFDRNKADALLKEAGWNVNPRTRMREKDGRPMFIDMWSRKGATNGDFETAELIQAQLREVGIGVNLTILDPAYWHAQITVAPDKAKYDMISTSWGTFTCDAEYTMNYLFVSTSVPPGRRNRMFYKNPEVDRLIEQGNVAPTVAERNRYYAAALRAIYEDAPLIQLFQIKEAIAFKNTVRGAEIDPCQLTHPAQFAWKAR
ncbi:MAG: hypothetical protein HY660_00455 [Armatimonadetes bacterium]|nr:hypothetical protein [Armatimonadota bacterium]